MHQSTRNSSLTDIGVMARQERAVAHTCATRGVCDVGVAAHQAKRNMCVASV